MVNYYDILKVSPQASTAEIKSAYRRLARQLHPDKNQGSEETALKFAAIAEAYEILGSSKQRHRYDRRLSEILHSTSGTDDSVFESTNRHAKRWRQMVYEKRYNDIIDRMIAEERREALGFQKAIYPLVALLVSSIWATAFKPKIFSESEMLGRLIIVTLFVIGIIHIIGRIRDGFERYTESSDDIHESILDESDRKRKPYSRLVVGFSLLGGVLLALGIGLVVGRQTNFAANMLPSMFSTSIGPEFLFYPPIITVFVDLMHTLVARFDR